MDYRFNHLRNDWKQRVRSVVGRSVFFPFLWIGFSFATLQASGKTPWDIEKLHISDIGFDKNLAPSHEKCSESLSMPVSL